MPYFPAQIPNYRTFHHQVRANVHINRQRRINTNTLGQKANSASLPAQDSSARPAPSNHISKLMSKSHSSSSSSAENWD